MEKAHFKVSLFLCCGRGTGNSSAWGEQVRAALNLLCGTSGRRKLYMVSCHSCYIYRIWRSKEVGEHFKAIIKGGNISYKGGQFLWDSGVFTM